MNVLLIISDTVRHDHCGCYGSPGVRAPHFDALAREGTLMKRFFTASFPTDPRTRLQSNRRHDCVERRAQGRRNSTEGVRIMIGSEMAEALNLQMNREFFNSRLYLSMAAYFESLKMEGAAHWMELQAEEETGHAMRLYEHLRERGARILLSALEAPPTEWDSPLAAFEAAYEHECKVTRQFDEHVALAHEQEDNESISFLQWFVDEQVEEEASVNEVIQKMRMAKDAPGAPSEIDRMLAQRGKS